MDDMLITMLLLRVITFKKQLVRQIMLEYYSSYISDSIVDDGQAKITIFSTNIQTVVVVAI